MDLPGEETPIRSYMCDRSKGTRHGTLIDPADQTPEIAAKRAIAAASAGSKLILVGGSSDTDMANVHSTVIAIKEGLELVEWASSQDASADETNQRIPVILFPQGAAALSPAADAITFMMLMNSTDPRFLIEEQVRGAPYVRKAGIEPVPMGYVICAPGGKAGEVGNVELVQSNDVNRAAAYAMTAECMGFSILYLEAGSGAHTPVSRELIRAARQSCNLPLIVGGGIRDADAARAAAEAGADWVITGTITEEYGDADALQAALSELIAGLSG